MKINQLDRFPHPMLEESTGDYLSGKFSVEVDLAESLKTGALLINYDVLLTEPSLEECATGGKAQVCLFITCLETYYNVLHKLDFPKGSLEIAQGLLSGNVNLLPMVIAADAYISISNSNWHEDFRGIDFHPEIGEILALGNPFQLNVGREKLAPIESIFEMAVNDSVLPERFQISLDGERVSILAERETHRAICDIRNTVSGRTILLNGVYFPAVIEILSALQEDSGPYKERRWHRVFTAKCTLEGIDIQNPDLIGDAQKLLKSPLARVIKMMQEDS